MKISLFFMFILFSLLQINCKKTQIINPPDSQSSNGKIIFKINKENTPDGIVYISANLSREGFETKTGIINLLSNNSGDILFEDIEVGQWYLKVEAEDSSGLVLYKGETEVNVLDGITIEVILNLERVENGTGNIYLYVTWGATYSEFVYNFVDNNLDGWVGPAYREVRNGKLNLSSIQGYIWRYIVDDATSFSEGELNADVFIEDGAYLSIEAKGHLEESYDINWGFHTQFDSDSLFNVRFIDNKSKKFYTGFQYQSAQWYYIKIKFNCNDGAKGQYELWIRPKFSNEELLYLGKYDFRNGRIIGINHFGFGVGDIKLNTVKHAMVDNIYLKLKK